MTNCEYCPRELCAPLGKYDRCDCECHPARDEAVSPEHLDQYTPVTAEEVRVAYEGVYKPRFAGSELAGPLFDRWLLSVKREAWDEGHAMGWAFGDPQSESDYYKDPTKNPYGIQEK